MKISKDIRRLSRNLVRASFVEGALDRERINAVVQSIVASKPRHYIQLLENYQRLLRLEVEKRRATIESAAELDPGASREIVSGLERKYGVGLTTEFVINPALLGGVRVRVGSDVWDSSVRNRLERLQQQL
ncbi:MAG: F0F1 ATP synthase subunit delta [Chthoniobacterales bacterium]|nr:F0F1 ATP synthase subunit delta [Chthoniobacterales bacterium]